MRQAVSQLHYIDLLNEKMSAHPQYTPKMRAWLHPEGTIQTMGVNFDSAIAYQTDVFAWACMRLAETHVVEPPLSAG